MTYFLLSKETSVTSYLPKNQAFFYEKTVGSLWTCYRLRQGLLQGLSLGAGVYALGEQTGVENDFFTSSYARVDLLAAYTWQLGPARLTA